MNRPNPLTLGKHCLNCEILLAERADGGRYNIYCRKCITEQPDEVRRHRWRRYYQRKREVLKPKMRERTRKWWAENKDLINAYRRLARAKISTHGRKTN